MRSEAELWTKQKISIRKLKMSFVNLYSKFTLYSNWQLHSAGKFPTYFIALLSSH